MATEIDAARLLTWPRGNEGRGRDYISPRGGEALRQRRRVKASRDCVQIFAATDT